MREIQPANQRRETSITVGRRDHSRAPDNRLMKPTLSQADVGGSWRGITQLGFVSLLIAIASESARASAGPLLQDLRASAAAVGIVAGSGELLGYTLRLAAGNLADRRGGSWRLLFGGTTLGLAAVALLALAREWWIAAVLLIAERVGRAIRTPARDVMLASLSDGIGHGPAFGFHRLFDQAGGIVGPLVVAALMSFGWSYQGSFAVLVLPAAGSLVLLLAMRPSPKSHEAAEQRVLGPLPKELWVLCGTGALLAAGTADFALIAFHYAKTGAAVGAAIPALYAAAMCVEAGAALALGFVLNRLGRWSLLLTIAMSAVAGPLIFSGAAAPVLAVALWSAGMGGQYLLLRAMVPQVVGAARRGAAFGLFNTVFGLAWFAGSAAMGVLYARNPSAVGWMSAGLQLSAVPVLFYNFTAKIE